MDPEQAYKSFLTMKRFDSLDGLRCLSIVAVLWHHSGIRFDFPLFHRGQLGVHLFFVISGFLITTLMIRERRKHGEISLRKFYMRRSLRIFPLYYAILMTYVVVVAVMEHDTADGKEFFDNLLAYATYTSNWFVELESGERVIFYFSWSLAVEEHFYMTWPWIERFTKERLKIVLLLGLIAIVLANHLGLLLWLFPGDSLMHRILWRIAPCILLGVLSAHVMHNKRGFGILFRLFGHVWTAPAMLVVVFGIASIERSGQVWEYVVYLSLVGLVISCTIRNRNGLSAVLQIKPLVRLGTVSYGIYLMHLLCFNAVWTVGSKLGITNQWLLWSIGVMLVYLIAEVSFRTFERYFQNWKLRYARC